MKNNFYHITMVHRDLLNGKVSHGSLKKQNKKGGSFPDSVFSSWPGWNQLGTCKRGAGVGDQENTRGTAEKKTEGLAYDC